MLRAVNTRGVVLGPQKVLAIDASLTGTGLAFLSWQGMYVGLLSPHDKARGGARLRWLHDRLAKLLDRLQPDCVIMEGYAFGASNNREALGEWGGIIRLLLAQRGIPYHIASPNTLKLFVTGKSQCEKSVVSKELFKRWAVDLNENNEVDAAALALIGWSKIGGHVEMTAAQAKAIAKLESGVIHLP